MPCDPTNASTFNVSGSTKLGTLGAVSSTKLQGILGATNYVSFCSSSSKGASSIQGPTFGTQFLASWEPTKKIKEKAKIKKVFKEKWATQFPWDEPVVDLASKTHMLHYKVCSLVEGEDNILNFKLDGL